jgi:hypothetical protein
MARGGARPGAGRPQGTREPHTLERERLATRLADALRAFGRDASVTIIVASRAETVAARGALLREAA